MSDNNQIQCHQCGAQIQIDQALEQKLKAKLETEHQSKLQDLAQQKAQLEAESKAQAEKLKEQKASIEKEVQSKLEKEKLQMWEKAKTAAKEKMSTEMTDLQAQLKEKNTTLEKAREHELELRKKARELEEQKKNFELEMQRKMDEERSKVAQKIKEDLAEENAKKDREKEQQMEQLRKTIADLKRKSEQGSMQVQGDAQEEDLKFILMSQFPSDQIDDVPTGIKGADLIQTVRNELGQDSGIIAWESKSTKAWNNEWIRKLKEDQGLVKANLAILISRVLPEGLKNFGLIDGVWVIEYKYATAIATILRSQLIEIAKTKKSLEGTDEKMAILHQYLTGPQFKNRIENIVLAFTQMQENLVKEQRAIQRLWAKREKEIQRVTTNTIGLYGDLQGIVGNALPAVQALELEAPDLDDLTT